MIHQFLKRCQAVCKGFIAPVHIVIKTIIFTKKIKLRLLIIVCKKPCDIDKGKVGSGERRTKELPGLVLVPVLGYLKNSLG